MIAIATTIVSALTSLVSGRIYTSTFPQLNTAQVWPAIRLTFTAVTPHPDQCGSEDEATDDVAVQIDAVAATLDAALALRSAIISALAAVSVPAERLPGGFLTFDAETRTHRAVLLYEFRPSTPDGSP